MSAFLRLGRDGPQNMATYLDLLAVCGNTNNAEAAP